MWIKYKRKFNDLREPWISWMMSEKLDSMILREIAKIQESGKNNSELKWNMIL